MEEVWKNISGYEGLYWVSNLGRIKSKRKLLKQSNRNKFGYKVVSLSKNNVVSSVSVHRLVASYFVPNQENKPQVGHLDNNPANNRADNLEWNTQGENLKYCFECGNRSNKGEKSPIHKITEKDVLYIRKHYQRGNRKKGSGNSKELAKKFGICPRSISDIVCRRSWKHI